MRSKFLVVVAVIAGLGIGNRAHAMDEETQGEALIAAHQQISQSLETEQLLELATALLTSNMEYFHEIYNYNRKLQLTNSPEKKSRNFRPDCEITAIRKEKDHSRYPYFVATLKCTDHEKTLFDDSLEFRSNGHAAFIARSYRFSRYSPRFFMSYLDQHGFAKAHDQTAVIIGDLDKFQFVSRTMAKEEYSHWKSGNLNLIQQHFAYTRFGDGRLRTFFALNYYEYHTTNSKVSAIMKLPKDILYDLYSNGHIEVHTYEDSENYGLPDGLSPEARTSFGLEVELVVLDQEGREKILPFMQNPQRVVEHQ